MTQEDLILEEQAYLDALIKRLDRIVLDLEKSYTYESLQAKKAKEKCLPDTYGQLVYAEYEKLKVKKELRKLYNI